MSNLKKHLSLQEQVDKLVQRGLIVEDRLRAEKLLSNLNYYRFSGYLHAFKVPGTDRYATDISFDSVKLLYDFDRKLTRLLMYALEDIEETFKTRLSYTMTSMFPDDPLIYMNPAIYRTQDFYQSFSQRFSVTVKNNSSLPFVKHHNKRYGGALPMWVAVELFTMGNLQAIYSNLLTPYQKAIASSYNTGVIQLNSWIENLTYTRNHLAHYMRIYNFNFGRTPVRGNNHPSSYTPTWKIFDQICIMSFLYSDAKEWNEYVLDELDRLLSSYSAHIRLSCIGFPADWKVILKR